MSKTRLEAFSDGVIAILITIMVLELKPPQEASIGGLLKLWPTFSAYLLSFLFLGIYWNNHHHLLQASRCVNGKVLWANLHLLFWLSLVPFTTAWMGANPNAPLPVAAYGMVLLFSGGAYFRLARHLVQYHGSGSDIATALGKDAKSLGSLAAYALAVPLAFVHTYVSFALYFGVAVLWLAPDPRIERVLE